MGYEVTENCLTYIIPIYQVKKTTAPLVRVQVKLSQHTNYSRKELEMSCWDEKTVQFFFKNSLNR